MQSTIQLDSRRSEAQALLVDSRAEWHRVEQDLGLDLEGSAQASGAFLRKREIQAAIDLLRLILYWVTSDQPLRLVAAWAFVQGMGYLSDVAVLKRLRQSGPWIGSLIGQLLARRCCELQQTAGVRVRLRDATVITRPGSHGTDWRVHLGLNLDPLGVDDLAVTDEKGGESLARFAPQPGTIEIADRGHAFVSGLGPRLAASLALVVRINWQNLPIQTAAGQRFPLIAWLQGLSGPSETQVWLPTPGDRFALRLMAFPLTPDKAEQARRRARKNNRKKGRTVSQATLVAAGFVLLVTNLPATTWPLARVGWLYRMRWQIELYFKSLKSLLHLDGLRAHDPQVAQTYLRSKLLSALLMDQLRHQIALQQPDWFLSTDRPVSLWRLTEFLWPYFCQLVRGWLSLSHFLQVLPALGRYFRDSPRARPQLLAWFRSFLDPLDTSFAFVDA